MPTAEKGPRIYCLPRILDNRKNGILLGIVLGGVVSMWIQGACAQTLKPYLYSSPSTSAGSAPESTQPAIHPDSYYDTFMEKAHALSRAERAKLSRRFSLLRDQTARKNDSARTLHYSKLVNRLKDLGEQ